MVMEFHPNSRKPWKKIEAENGIRILFFDKNGNWIEA